MEYEHPTFPELKIWHPVKTLRLWGSRVLGLVGVAETALHRPDHYELRLPRDEQLQIDFEAQPLGEAPVLPRMKPPENRWDESGRYL